MCGICGIARLDGGPVHEPKLRRMTGMMEHRGPDDEGYFVEDWVGLGHRRLSILDLSSRGHQPMVSDDDRFVLTYNGEVYNYIELRQELEPEFTFKTETDTEVLLNAFRKWGEDCLHRLNGMFAFAIYDRTEERIFAARDRFGIKPFYYHYSPGLSFVFASEIPSVLAGLDARAEPDSQIIFDYLAFSRTDFSERTFFSNVSRLSHGHCLWVDRDGLRLRRWYDLSQQVDRAFANAEEYRDTFRSAVRLRLRSDVPVGVCLSGGLDSSSIVSTVLGLGSGTDLNTFSAVYGEGQRGDESRFISEYRDTACNMHFTWPTASTLLVDIPRLIQCHSEPVASLSQYAQFKVMELAKDHVVVLLDGQGADEQLAGYHYFFGYLLRQHFRSFSWLNLLREGAWYLRRHRSTYAVKSFLYFLLPASLQTRARVVEKSYIDAGFTSSHGSESEVPERIYGSSSLNAALFDHFENKLEHLLKWEDSNSMFFSLESRVPFLDYRMVEGTLALPPEDIIRQGYTKYILREAMNGVIPETIRTRVDKVGFETPSATWFRTEAARELIMDILLSRSFRERAIVNTRRAEHLYSRHLSGSVDIANDIWKWVNLELWYRKYIDA